MTPLSDPALQSEPLSPLAEAVVVVLLPLVTLLLQFLLFDLVQPFVWLGFLPAVAGVAWLCGVRGGLLAMVLSLAMAEWLLALPLPLPGMAAAGSDSPRANLAAAVLFSLLAVSVVFSLQKVRREKFALDGAAVPLWPQLSLKTADVTDAESLLRALPAEFAWREAVLAELPLGVAVYSAQGVCVRANAPFARSFGMAQEDVLKATLFGGTLPVEGLAAAAQRLTATASFEHLDEVIRSEGKLYRLHWIALVADGLIMLTVQEDPSQGAAARLRAAAPATPVTAIALPASTNPASANPSSANPSSSNLASVYPDSAVAGEGKPPQTSAFTTAPRPPLQPLPPRPSALPQTVPTPSPGPLALNGLRCLIVDDQRLNRDLLGEILRLEGAIPTLCASGAEALQAVAAGRDQFDVVLMDIQMPGMDGFQTTRQLRGLPGAADLPVFAVTADGAVASPAALLAADMQGLLGKPLDVDHLFALLSRQRRG